MKGSQPVRSRAPHEPIAAAQAPIGRRSPSNQSTAPRTDPALPAKAIAADTRWWPGSAVAGGQETRAAGRKRGTARAAGAVVEYAQLFLSCMSLGCCLTATL